MRQDDTVLIRITLDLPAFFGTRTEEGRALTFALGDPVEATGTGEPVYVPTMTATDDGKHVCGYSRHRHRPLRVVEIGLRRP